MLQQNIINKILTSKYLYYLAKENIKSNNRIKISVGINLLQDAIELFLVAVSLSIIKILALSANKNLVLLLSPRHVGL